MLPLTLIEWIFLTDPGKAQGNGLKQLGEVPQWQRKVAGRKHFWKHFQTSPVWVELWVQMGWDSEDMAENSCRKQKKKWSVIKAVTILQRIWPLLAGMAPQSWLAASTPASTADFLERLERTLLWRQSCSGSSTFLKVQLWVVLFNLLKFSCL